MRRYFSVHILVFPILLSFILVLVPFNHCNGQSLSQVELTPTFIESSEPTHPISADQDFIFGYLQVPENRQSSIERMIKVPVYIFKSRSSNPNPDPIIYTVGGPGSSTMSSAQYMNYYKYLDDRDFILIEQRGTRYSEPHLDCPGWSDSIKREAFLKLTGNSDNDLIPKVAKACRDSLVNSGIDLNGYRTSEIAADIVDLVNVLEIDQYNLLTISYSTKIAQVLMRDHPEKIRSVVMDSSLPLSVSYDEESVSNLLKTVELVLNDCEKDAACNQSFPAIKSRFFEYLTSISSEPIKLTVINPQNSEPVTLFLYGSDLINIFNVASTYPENDIPYEIQKLLNNDLSSVELYLTDYFLSSGNSFSMGMRLSVWCSEEHPFNDQNKIESESKAYPEVLGLSPALFNKEVCTEWNVLAENRIENEPVQSDIPVLLINGEYDNETPVHWSISMQKTLSNSYHLVFKGWGHTPTTNWGNQCAMIAANDFFNKPDEMPSPSCLKDLVRPAFKID